MTESNEEGRVPSWAQAPLIGFREYVEQEHNLVLLSTKGIEQTAKAVPLVKALEDLGRDLGGDDDLPAPSERVAEAERLAALAKTEIDNDFRLLHGHSIVGVWGALETMVTDLIGAWLLNFPQARQMPQVADFKISVSEFESLTSEERMQAIVNELDRRNITRVGINRFELLLDSVALGGVLQLAARRQPVRNAADPKSLCSPPWRGGPTIRQSVSSVGGDAR